MAYKRRTMIKETWNEIVQNQDVRQNLSKLRQEMKAGRGRPHVPAFQEKKRS